MKKERFNYSEFEVLTQEQIKELYLLASTGYINMLDARRCYQTLTKNFNNYYDNIKQKYYKIDSCFMDIITNINALGLPEELKNKVESLQSEYLTDYKDKEDIKSEVDWKLVKEAENKIPLVRKQVIIDLNAYCKSIKAPFYRRINETMDDYEILQLIRACFRVLFESIHIDDVTNYRFTSAGDSMYINDEYIDLYNIESIQESYDKYVKAR